MLVSGMKAIVLITINLFILKVLKRDKERILFLVIGESVTFALLSYNSVFVFVVAYMLWNLLAATQTAFFNPILHDSLPGSHRSTAVSSFSALESLVVFGGSALIGLIVQYYHSPRAAHMFFTAICLFLIIPCMIWIIGHLDSNMERI